MRCTGFFILLLLLRLPYCRIVTVAQVAMINSQEQDVFNTDPNLKQLVYMMKNYAEQEEQVFQKFEKRLTKIEHSMETLAQQIRQVGVKVFELYRVVDQLSNEVV